MYDNPYTCLRWDSGTYGKERLKQLAMQAQSPDIRNRAAVALALYPRLWFDVD